MNHNTILKDEYEKYKIPLSFAQLFPKQKKKYIWGELEKRHPCFSDDYCYFTKLKFSRKGFYSDIFVVDKSKLTKTGKKVFIDDNNKINFFLTGNSEIIFISLVFLIFIVLILTCLNYSKKSRENNNIVCKLEQKSVKNEKNSFVNKKYKDFDNSVVEKYLKIVSDNSGQINKFIWNVNYNGEIFSSEVKSVYPEKLETYFTNCSISPIVYNEKTPLLNFKVSNAFQVTRGEIQNRSESFSKAKELIRSFLLFNKINLIGEESNPYRIKFNLGIDKFNLEKYKIILIQLEKLFKSENLIPIEIQISQLQSSNTFALLSFNISFSQDINLENDVFSIIGKNFNLFVGNQNLRIPSKKITNQTLTKDSKENPNKIIGVVNYKSGKKILFYKTPQGKIIKEEVANEA